MGEAAFGMLCPAVGSILLERHRPPGASPVKGHRRPGESAIEKGRPEKATMEHL